VRVTRDFGNALNEISQHDVQPYRQYEHDLAVDALTIAANGGAHTESEFTALSGTPNGWPRGSTVPAEAMALVDKANALEVRGEAETFGDRVNTPRGLKDFQVAALTYQQAIAVLESYRSLDRALRLNFDRPRDELRNPRHFELYWANARDRLALDLLQEAKLPGHPTVDLNEVFIALGKALKLRAAVQTDWAWTATRLALAYELDVEAQSDLPELARAQMCIAQARSILEDDNPAVAPLLRGIAEHITTTIAQVRATPARPSSSMPVDKWVCRSK